MVWWFGAENADELWARLAHQHEVLEADKRRRNERRLQCAGEAFAYGIVSLSVDISSIEFRERFADKRDRDIFDRNVLHVDAWTWDPKTGLWYGVATCPHFPHRPPPVRHPEPGGSEVRSGPAQCASVAVLEQADRDAEAWRSWLELMREREGWELRQQHRASLLATEFGDRFRMATDTGVRLRAVLHERLPRCWINLP